MPCVIMSYVRDRVNLFIHVIVVNIQLAWSRHHTITGSLPISEVASATSSTDDGFGSP